MRMLCLGYIIVCILLPCVALADGMVMVHQTSAETRVVATDQRAVMWLRNGVWEIHIQPVFSRQQAQAAWIVPFSVKPQVQEGTLDFFEQLEIITSPKFAQFCWVPHCCSGWMCDGGSASGGDDLVGGQARVHVWEKGELGDLKYVIISAADGESLAAWLELRGYNLPDRGAGLLAEFETEGTFFFVATLSPEADPDKPLAPVRFVLPGLDPPAYPLRLTALGVSESESLDLTVWVVFPDGQGYAPGSHPTGELGSFPANSAQYDQALDDFFESHSADTLVTLYGLSIRPEVLGGLFCFDEDYYSHDAGMGNCLSFYSLELTVPETWSEEIIEIHQKEQRVYSYQARLTAAAMASDLVLVEKQADELFHGNNMYRHYTGNCYSCPSDGGLDGAGGAGGGCSTAGGLSLVGILAVIFAGVALRIRRNSLF